MSRDLQHKFYSYANKFSSKLTKSRIVQHHTNYLSMSHQFVLVSYFLM